MASLNKPQQLSTASPEQIPSQLHPPHSSSGQGATTGPYNSPRQLQQQRSQSCGRGAGPGGLGGQYSEEAQTGGFLSAEQSHWAAMQQQSQQQMQSMAQVR